MDQRTRPAPRLAPLGPEHTPELNEHFETARKRMGFVPNSILIMQRNPKMVRGFTQMSAAIWDPEGKVDLKLKRLISHVASRSAGCKYCMAHTAEGAAKLGLSSRSWMRCGTTRPARCLMPRNAQPDIGRPITIKICDTSRIEPCVRISDWRRFRDN